ncbi:hypothetical protein C0V97_09220 [Asaia sp. W19]|uniref:Imm42 family immunity protein n=1 Tax=unclassified Asaia TaxID=2685023 RepID=UPI000F8EB9FF|nr:Imm42 family immunity protein [Asaia sp. W19]RUT25869.1 hypothetical protein C0V97_09220 [Asaia sp. W19]
MKSNILFEFGDSKSFSILVGMDKSTCGEWMNGYFYMCINSHILGNDSMVSLRDVMHELEGFIDGRKDRISGSLFALRATDIFNLITNSLYDIEENPMNSDGIYDYISQYQAAGDFRIKPRVQSMSGADIFSVTNNSNIAKIIYSLDRKNIEELVVNEITISDSIESAYQYLKEIHDNSDPV